VVCKKKGGDLSGQARWIQLHLKITQYELINSIIDYALEKLGTLGSN
jgi:hypothetical protein